MVDNGNIGTRTERSPDPSDIRLEGKDIERVAIENARACPADFVGGEEASSRRACVFCVKYWEFLKPWVVTGLVEGSGDGPDADWAWAATAAALTRRLPSVNDPCSVSIPHASFDHHLGCLNNLGLWRCWSYVRGFGATIVQSSANDEVAATIALSRRSSSWFLDDTFADEIRATPCGGSSVERSKSSPCVIFFKAEFGSAWVSERSRSRSAGKGVLESKV